MKFSKQSFEHFENEKNQKIDQKTFDQISVDAIRFENKAFEARFGSEASKS